MYHVIESRCESTYPCLRYRRKEVRYKTCENKKLGYQRRQSRCLVDLKVSVDELLTCLGFHSVIIAA